MNEISLSKKHKNNIQYELCYSETRTQYIIYMTDENKTSAQNEKELATFRGEREAKEYFNNI